MNLKKEINRYYDETIAGFAEEINKERMQILQNFGLGEEIKVKRASKKSKNKVSRKSKKSKSK